MAITKSDFPILTQKIEYTFNEAVVNSLAEMVGGQIFDEVQTDMFTSTEAIFHALPGVRRVAEGQQFPKVTGVQGDTTTYTQRHFGADVEVTKIMRMFDRYNEIDNLVRSAVDSSMNDIDQSYADHLLNGWSTTFTDVWGDSVSGAAADGLALFSTVHNNNLTSRTYRNQITDGTNENAVLSRDAIVNARRLARVYRDPQGKNRPIRLNKLLVSPRNEDMALRLVNSTGISGTPNVDINPLKGLVEVVTWEKLETRSDGTDTSNYWFMFDSGKVKHSLKALWAQKPSISPPEEAHLTKSWDYTIDALYATGVAFPAYIWGSKGTDAA